MVLIPVGIYAINDDWFETCFCRFGFGSRSNGL
jgi:hypothetical protein